MPMQATHTHAGASVQDGMHVQKSIKLLNIGLELLLISNMKKYMN